MKTWPDKKPVDSNFSRSDAIFSVTKNRTFKSILSCLRQSAIHIAILGQIFYCALFNFFNDKSRNQKSYLKKVANLRNYNKRQSLFYETSFHLPSASVDIRRPSVCARYKNVWKKRTLFFETALNQLCLTTHKLKAKFLTEYTGGGVLHFIHKREVGG